MRLSDRLEDFECDVQAVSGAVNKGLESPSDDVVRAKRQVERSPEAFDNPAMKDRCLLQVAKSTVRCLLQVAKSAVLSEAASGLEIDYRLRPLSLSIHERPSTGVFAT